MKYCNTCKELKYENDFGKHSDTYDGLKYKCKDCCRVYQKEYQKQNRERMTECHNEWQKKRYHSDPNFRMKMCMSARLSRFKHSETLEKYKDCTDDYYKKWLEYQFTDGMTFDNHGKVWHIDHVLPVSFFNHEKEEEIYMCWNWMNLRPLKVSDNISKRDKVDFTLYQNQLVKAFQFKLQINQNQLLSQPMYQPMYQPIQPEPMYQPMYQPVSYARMVM